MTHQKGIDVGTVIGPLVVPAVTRTTLARFATASGDDNTIHLDPRTARAAGYEDVIAHGMLSMAYLGRLLTTWVRQDDIRSYRVRFVAVTPLGAEPVCEARVTAIDDVAGERLATLDLRVGLADGTTTVVGEAVVAIDGKDRTV